MTTEETQGKAERSPSATKIDVIGEQIKYIGETMKEIRGDMSDFERRRTEEWVEYKVEHARVVADLTSLGGRFTVFEVDAKSRFATVEENIKKLERSVSPLITSNKILVWMGGILGASIIIFIWGLITHSVQVVTSVP